MAERDRATTVLRVGAGEGFIPSKLQGGGVDDELCGAVFDKVIHAVLDKRFLKDGHKGFGQNEAEGLQTRTQAGA